MPFHPWALPLAWQLQNCKAHLAFSEKSRGVIGLDCLTCFKMLTARFHAVRHLYSRLETQERHSSSLRIFNSFKIKKKKREIFIKSSMSPSLRSSSHAAGREGQAAKGPRDLGQVGLFFESKTSTGSASQWPPMPSRSCLSPQMALQVYNHLDSRGLPPLELGLKTSY